jgi:cob(I)alamin adenosyltransferase
MGDVDELNSNIGLLLTETLPDAVRDALVGVQHDLFDLGGELSLPGHTLVTEAHLSRIDNLIEQFNNDLPPLREFILPGGSRAAALAHVARVVCRRAERTLVNLRHNADLHSLPSQYLNRLSDLLFVLARVINRAGGGSDVHWQQGRKPG